MTLEEKWLLEEKYGGTRTPAFEADCKRLASGDPLAYVIGFQPFLGLKIFLDSKPLIPRPETEWWVEEMLSKTGEAAGPFRFLDLCAGSGAIGCAALACLPSTCVYFGEIDSAHEPTIRKNISENNLDTSRADIRIGDLFEPFGEMTFDLIAANPPYIPNARILPESVSRFEPERALRAGGDGLSVIRRIAERLPKHLAPGGAAYIECDSAHAAAACALFSARELAAHIENDQYDAPRVIVASFS